MVDGQLLGSSGTATTSKTLFQQNGVRIDVENPSPGVRAGQVHVQIGKRDFLRGLQKAGELLGVPETHVPDQMNKNGIASSPKIRYPTPSPDLDC
jgi:hypothetical protein